MAQEVRQPNRSERSRDQGWTGGAARDPAVEAAPEVNTPPPPDEGAPLVCGLQSQAVEGTRGFRPAGSREWLLIAAMAGLGRVRAGGRDHTLRPGDLLLFAPDTPQDYGHLHERAGWVNVWAHVRPRPHWLPWLGWPQVARGIHLLSAGDRWTAIEPELRRMVEVAGQPTRLHHDLALNSLERVLILCDEANPLHREAGLDPRVRRAMEIVGADLASPLDVSGLSRAVGLSRSRFTVVFTAATGLSPQAYIEHARLARAAQMLALSSWPVARIAEQVGIPNAYYFSTRFRRRYGMPPSAYRTRFNEVSRIDGPPPQAHDDEA